MANELADMIKNVFSDATILTFAKMTSVELTPAPAVAQSGADGADVHGVPQFDLSAVIGFTGDLVGNCALRLSSETAQEAITRLAGETIDSTFEIADGVGELVNMIAGNAKAALQDRSISLSFPEVIRGKGHEIGFYRHPSVIGIDYTSEIGKISVVVAFSGKTDAITEER
jgi:chemotaxis protein CheX